MTGTDPLLAALAQHGATASEVRIEGGHVTGVVNGQRIGATITAYDPEWVALNMIAHAQQAAQR